jgi:hypothetical protein
MRDDYSDMKKHQTLCQEGMAKMIDTVYRAMQRDRIGS